MSMIKTVILAGGLGSRLAEETILKPKPMVEIGGHPILWHIMNLYAAHGFENFVVALGFKGHCIKEYFMHYFASNSDMTINLNTGGIRYHDNRLPNWNVQLLDTGQNTLTGGRLLRLKTHLDKETFMLTYGDGVSNVDINRLLAFHKQHGKLATVTVVRPPARFGTMVFEGDRVAEFQEKPQTGEGWINGGFFVFEPEIFDYLDDDQTILERSPMERLAQDGELMAYKHEDFWQCMDTLRDRNRLEELWQSGDAPWAVWQRQQSLL